jgi:hypothetical protein
LKLTTLIKTAVVAVLTAAGAVALAANTQVSTSRFKKPGAVYGRSDGLYQEKNTNGVYVVENGTGAKAAGFGYRETWTSGDYAAVPSAIMTIAGLIQSASAQQLDIGYFGAHSFIFGQGTAQTILPVTDSTGLDISGDQVNGEAYEMFAGVLGASGRPAVIGVDPAFYFCVTAKIADASGASKFQIGFRSATQTQQAATITNYLNYATIGTSGTANPNTIYMLGGNDDTDTSQDTGDTWADAAVKRLCINVSATGVVTATNNGAAPTTPLTFSFDDGDSVIPFIFLVQGSDLTEAVDITEWAVGYTTP